MDGQAIFTVGYGQLEFEAFAELIEAHGIEYVADVRSKPFSKFRPEFCKDTLAALLGRVGIRYLFMGDVLGGRPSDQSCYTNGWVDYDKCRKKPTYIEGIARLQDASDKGLRVAIMCSEKQPENCHRSKLIGETLASLHIPVQHILHDGTLVSHDVLVESAKDPQRDLFGHYSKMNFSRKKYTTSDS